MSKTSQFLILLLTCLVGYFAIDSPLTVQAATVDNNQVMLVYDSQNEVKNDKKISTLYNGL